MKDRLLVLLLLGVGVIKVYEEYDEEEKEERDPLELIKHKHNKRDLDSFEKTLLIPIPIKEEIIEATSRGLSPKLRVKCKDLEDECSCKRLLCFGPNSCESMSNYSTEMMSHNSTEFVWLHRCRQTFLMGQNLCECKRLLFHKKDAKLLTPNTENIPLMED
uniref:Clone ZZD371 mRNA sequence n=1 Tax=Schistosoma japonicum TaxID=6182 RepID=Q86EH9_SCHJA|nr:hypothetical protein [Schistosoma japonicum]CAX70711.1 hypothetical protein [Schistosoma japonicum]CAX75713.1 hypothetical protein [Schistosoma japonicum]CAX75714.1 hypothetical protein [Schistosoma japonicum]